MLNYECQTYLARSAKESEDEKRHCLSFRAHNPKVSLCKAATLVSCETNSTSVEAAQVPTFHIVKPQRLQRSAPFESD